jgi:Flp pilus assembly protein TadD
MTNVPNEAEATETDPRDNFVPRFLPWLLALVMLLVYGFTLGQWVSLFNVNAVARLSHWTWQPDLLNPVAWIVTYPLRWLPVTMIPLALNMFTAVCASLTLGMLARSVAILPHNRTDAQRTREMSEFSFLTIFNAWLPPVLAVLVAGLQLTFWEQATNYTGEMFDLLLFAFVIWSLLEFRLDGDDRRLFLAALVYGASMADNWAMIGFFPLFIGMIVWIRGIAFFNLQFLGRMALCGLVGMSFYLLLPLLAVISGKFPVTFWEALHYNLGGQFNMIKLVFVQDKFRQAVELLALTSLVPMLMLAVRWPASVGDSRFGNFLTNFVFNLVSLAFLVIGLWAAFDTPIGTRHLGMTQFGIPFLTFSYLGALGIGYFSGYFLLVFGQDVVNQFSEVLIRSRHAKAWDFAGVIGICLLAFVAVAGLAWKNIPLIRAANDDTLLRYSALMVANLPRAGGYVLADTPERLVLAQSALAREKRAKDFVMLDSQSLPWPAYHHYLQKQYGSRWPAFAPAARTNAFNPLELIYSLASIARSNQIYYLHPSFGYYFEQFYLEPHGLVYKLNTLPNDTLLPPLPDQTLMAENETFWARAAQSAFGPIASAVAPVDRNASSNLGSKLLDRLHIGRHEQNFNVRVVGGLYSRSLDYWGVQLQRANELEKAALRFQEAQKLNPDNVVAQANLQFNESLRAKKKVPLDPAKASADQFGKSGSWASVWNMNGPFDEPSFCYGEGVMLVEGGLMRQAVAPFERVRTLAPEDISTRYWLAQLYLASRLPDRALDALHDVESQPEAFAITTANSTKLNVLLAGAYLQKNDLARGVQLLQAEVVRHPDDNELLAGTVQAYLARGLFTNALEIIDQKLRRTPDDPAWLFSKGFASMQIKAYDDAVTALTRVLSLQSTNNGARFDRAITYLNSDQLDAARADYLTLQQSFTNSFAIAYGLGEIAWRKHETNEAVRNYQVYLANANTNTAEATNIIQRLHDLKGSPP